MPIPSPLRNTYKDLDKNKSIINIKICIFQNKHSPLFGQNQVEMILPDLRLLHDTESLNHLCVLILAIVWYFLTFCLQQYEFALEQDQLLKKYNRIGQKFDNWSKLPGNFFGYRMFDLKTSINLDKKVISTRIDEKFDGTYKSSVDQQMPDG